MAEAYSWEIRENARGLFVVNGKTYDQVSKITGVSVSQLKRWGSEEEWSGRRKKFRRAQNSIEENKMLLRADLLQNAIDTKDPQDVYAAAAMEKLDIALKKIDSVKEDPPELPEMEFADPEDLVDKVWGAIQFSARKIISSPSTMDDKQLKILKDGFKLLTDLKQQYSKKSKEPRKIKELDPAAIQTIKDIYGITK